jgi:peptidoglycan/LPS O-acetylase OafA/YrhL
MGSERSAAEPSLRYIPGLDGLRAISIFLVVLCHVVPLYREEADSGWFEHFVRTLFGAGWIGVDLFFVISGFLITGILLASREAPRRYVNFYSRRAWRIFPLYYLYFVLVFSLLYLHDHRLSGIDTASVLFYFVNFRDVDMIVI